VSASPLVRAIERARLSKHRHAGLSFLGDHTAQNGRISFARSRYAMPGNWAAVAASLTTVRPRPTATSARRLSRRHTGSGFQGGDSSGWIGLVIRFFSSGRGFAPRFLPQNGKLWDQAVSRRCATRLLVQTAGASRSISLPVACESFRVPSLKKPGDFPYHMYGMPDTSDVTHQCKARENARIWS
jgi:hypothetical protein